MTAVTNSRNLASSKLTSRDTEKIYKLADKIVATRYLQMQKKRRDMMSKPIARIYIPRMDLCDDEALPRIYAAIELPGIEREFVALRVVDDVLHIEGQRMTPLQRLLPSSGHPSPSPAQRPIISITDDQGESVETQGSVIPHYTTRELAFGKFKREIALPRGTMSGQVAADLIDGMLYLSWPRNPQAASPASGSGGYGDRGPAHSRSSTSASPNHGSSVPSLSRATTIPSST